MSIFRMATLVAALSAAMPMVAAADEDQDLQLIPKTIRETAEIDQNQDLQLIPGGLPKNMDSQGAQLQSAANPGVPSEPANIAQGRLYVEDAVTGWTLRSPVVPVPGQVSVPDWQNRTSLDGRYDWIVAKGLDFTISDRLNVIEQSNINFPSDHNYRNDFREGFVSWEPTTQTYVDVGRINVKEGVALGFNPTDFFKTRTLVDQVSEDPSVLRDDRLGTAMVRLQQIWDGSSVSLAFAPKLVSPSALNLGFEPSLNPSFGQTNDDYRFLLTASHDFGYDWAPQVLVYHEATQTKVGANITHGIGNSVIAYAEWAGGRQLSLIDSALQFGKDTGAIPFSTPNLLTSGQGESFMNDLTVGASWSPTGKTMFNLEYIYHQAGFSRQDWSRWFAAGTTVPMANGPLWYIRSYAYEEEEPLSQHQIFLRAAWSDAFITNLQLSAFAFVDLFDGSTQGQIAATYNVSDAWTVGALVGAELGGPRTDYGSVPQAVNGILQLVRYF